MLLWILMALLAAAVALTVLVPLARGGQRQHPTSAASLSIYRDQMSEVDRDLGRGLIGDVEANAARTEIGRRLLRAGDAASAEPARKNEFARRAGVVAAIGAPILALGLYVLLGSPQLPDEPLAARLSAPPEQQDIVTLVTKVEAHLAANPNDGAGWEVIAPVYLRLGRYDDAARAFGNAIRLLGSTAQREAGYGDALVRAKDGLVTADARAAFERAARLDPKAVAPRFYLALALSQDGKKDEAIAAWQALLHEAPADAAWAPVAREWLARLGGASAPPGPTAEDVQAAGNLSSEQRLAMINGMVGQLAARLEANPGDAEGWARLVRSYMVLGRTDEAKAALAKARMALAANAGGLATVEAEARAAGIND